jgi:hypothetical protein
MMSRLPSLAAQDERHGFILVHDTFCHGVCPAEWGAVTPFVFYDTRAEAEAERTDIAELLAEADENAGMDPPNADDGPWVEAAVLHPDGALTLPDQGLAFSLAEMHAFLR